LRALEPRGDSCVWGPWAWAGMRPAGAGSSCFARRPACADCATSHGCDPPQTRTVTSKPSDPFDLQRFVDAQDRVYEEVCAELRSGRKRTHWIWYVFPQLRGLGSSEMATVYGISSRQEAAAYLDHLVLGPRLRECTRLVNLVEGRAIGRILGYPDDMKFRSSMTCSRVSRPAIRSSRTPWISIFVANPIRLRWNGSVERAAQSLRS
jgi:uncharacterized protein (DUF1810 family)